MIGLDGWTAIICTALATEWVGEYWWWIGEIAAIKSPFALRSCVRVWDKRRRRLYLGHYICNQSDVKPRHSTAQLMSWMHGMKRNWWVPLITNHRIWLIDSGGRFDSVHEWMGLHILLMNVGAYMHSFILETNRWLIDSVMHK